MTIKFIRFAFLNLVLAIASIATFLSSPALAEFVNGVECFDGQTLDLDTWEPRFIEGISQDDMLFMSHGCEYTTRTVTVPVGGTVGADVTLNSFFEGHGAGYARLCLSTNSLGTSQSYVFEPYFADVTLWAGINERPDAIYLTKGGSGAGRLYSIVQLENSGASLGQHYWFEVSRLSATEVQGSVFDENRQLLGRTIAPFAASEDLFITLYTNGDAVFDNVTVVIPEPNTITLVAASFLTLALGVLRRRKSI